MTVAMPLALRLAGAAGNLQGDCNLAGDCNLQACSAPSPSRWRLRRSRGRLCLTFAGKNQAWKGAASRFPPGRLARRERHRRSACCSRLLCSVTVPVLCCRLCLSFEEKTTMHMERSGPILTAFHRAGWFGGCGVGGPPTAAAERHRCWNATGYMCVFG